MQFLQKSQEKYLRIYNLFQVLFARFQLFSDKIGQVVFAGGVSHLDDCAAGFALRRAYCVCIAYGG
jgi:hypothetical protein